MRILYITQGFPDTRMVGGQIASYYNIVQLTRSGHEVIALCLVPRGTLETDPEALSRLARVHPVPDVPRSCPANYALNLFDVLPWPIRRYASRQLAREAKTLLRAGSYDLVLFNSLHSATLLPKVRKLTTVPCVLFEHNVQSTIMELYRSFQTNPLLRLYAFGQWRKMRAFEARACSAFDQVLTYSDVDRAEIRRLSPEARVRYVPLMLDVGRLAATKWPEEFDLLFAAYLGWAPNEDSLRWFIDEILPKIQDLRPGTDLEVVGAGTPARTIDVEHQDRSIRFRGRVDDIRPFYGRARVVVVPLRIGSGVRVKIIQAMAMGKAVVTTSKGCEGLAVTDGEHVAIADSPDEFARRTVRLLESEDERRAMGGRAQGLALRVHDALSPSPPLAALCEELVSKGSRR